MTVKSYNHILNFFFCAFALIMLSACGGSDSGGGSAGANSRLVDTTGDNDVTLYVNVDENGQSVLTYTPSDAAPSEFASWELALEDARTNEYNYIATNSSLTVPSADQIGASYAHARGYTGAGIIVSVLGTGDPSDYIELSELTEQLVQGYTTGSNIDFDACTAITCLSPVNAFVAPIIVARQDSTGMQGIAYDAKIKSVNIKGNDLIDNAHDAIRQASGADIAVMHANLFSFKTGMYREDGNVYYYEGHSDGYRSLGNDSTGEGKVLFDNFVNNQYRAWKDVVKTTVVVVPQGSSGHNSENGMVDIYTDEDFNYEYSGGPIAWATIDAANGVRNLGAIEARLPLEVPELQGKWLSVIALNEDNRIWEESNGCGDAKAWCLGAPGVNITSQFSFNADTDYVAISNTAFAAAHVTGAVAVLAEAFPNLTPDGLVSVILDTADDIGVPGVDNIYGHGALNLARAVEPIGSRTICLPSYPAGKTEADDTGCMDKALAAGITIDNSGITLPTSFGESLGGFTVGFIDDYKRAYIGNPTRITRENAAFTLGDTIATWDSPELKNITLDSNSKMQFSNYDENADAKDTLIFTHNLPNHTIGFSYNEESKTPDLSLTDKAQELHFQKIRPIASDLMQLHATHKLGKVWNVKNAITSGAFDTGNRFNEAMANLSYAGENHNLTIGAGTLQEYGQFLGASGTGAYQLSDATSSHITHFAVTQKLPRNSSVKVKYTNFKTEVDMRYNNFANINDLTANEYQLAFAKRKILGKNDSLNLEFIQPFAVTNGTLQQSTVLGYNDAGDYNNVTQNYDLKPANRRQQIRMTWQNQINLERKTKLFISMQHENYVNNLRDNEDSSILGGISTRC